MTEFINFLVVIGAGLLFSGLFSRVKIPYVTALIIAGVIIGPFGLNIIKIDPAIETIGAIGLIFLMFMAGLEVDITKKKEFNKNTTYLVILNSTLPFVTGFLIGFALGYGLTTSLIIGIVFISSSIAVITPQLEESGFIKRKLGKTILTGTMIEDILSLLLLSVALQTVVPKTALPLPLYFTIIILSILGLKLIFKKLQKFEIWLLRDRPHYEGELRFIFVVLIGTAIYFEALGMHAIIAGFVVGILLSETIKHEELLEKIRTLSYGLFIPTFFVIIGARLDLSIFFKQNGPLLEIFAITMGLITSKILSGFLAGKLSGFNKLESLFMGVSTTPHLSTALAAAFAAFEFGLLNNNIITALIFLSIVTTLISPIVLNNLTRKIKQKESSS